MESAYSAARPTTGDGRGTRATGVFCAPTSARTGSRLHSPRTTFRSSRSTGCKISTEGIKPGDLVFVAGYPGRTQRHQTYAQVKETTEWSYAAVDSPRAGTAGDSRPALQTGQGARAEGRRARAGAEQQSYQSERHARGTGEGRKPGNETGAGEGTRSVDRGRPGAAEEVRRRSAGAARASGGKREDAGTDRDDDDAGAPRPRYLGAAQTHLPPLGATSEGGHGSGSGVSGARLAEDSRRRRSACSARWMRRPTGRCSAGRWVLRPRCRPTSGSPRWTRLPG